MEIRRNPFWPKRTKGGQSLHGCGKPAAGGGSREEGAEVWAEEGIFVCSGEMMILCFLEIWTGGGLKTVFSRRKP